MEKVNRLNNHQVFLFSLSFFMCLLLVTTGFYDDVKAEGRIEIRTISDLNSMRECLTCDYVLMNDLDLTFETSDVEGVFFNEGLGWNPIGTFNHPFEGSFDGNGFKIIGLTINRDQNYVGLFGRIARTTNRDKRVENLVLKDVDVQGRDYIGALAGNTEYAVIDSISISGDIQGRMYVGGITGYAYYATINRVYSKANIIGLSTGIGGVLGRLGRNSEIRDVHVEGSVEGTLCQDSLAINCSVGGIVGRDESSSFGIFTSFFNGQLFHQVAYEQWINPQKYAQPILGLSYGSSLEFNYHSVDSVYFESGFVDEQDVSNSDFFAGFDFAYIWQLDEDLHLQSLYRFTQLEIYETSIVISSLPNKVNYVRGEAIDLSGMIVLLVLSDDSTSIIDDVNYVGSTNQVGTHSVMIYYNQFSSSFEIDVSDPIAVKIDIDAHIMDSNQEMIKLVIHSNMIEDIHFIRFKYSFDNEIDVIMIDCLDECHLVREKGTITVFKDKDTTLDVISVIFYVSYSFKTDQNIILSLTDIEYSTYEHSEMVGLEKQNIVLNLKGNQLIHDDELPNTSDLSLPFRFSMLIVLLIGCVLVQCSYRRSSRFV